MTQKKPFALLVSNGSDSFSHLKALLKTLGIETWSTKTFNEASQLLDQAHPELIFTGKLLSNRTWRDVIHMSTETSVPISVIVVGEYKDTRLYISAIDYGAFDCIFPPFDDDVIARVVRLASDSVHRRRESQAMGAVA